ncbi:hypothetical protein MJO52_12505 [Microbulbifer variabilis]|uniref:Uncharacterized protein n=1 Tax=Microbulbifer variabilis TaxID=266805 RepID=A0ABY4V6K2_9GAMM|nr:hypothetical protein [Microbulbifer variabilis]USD19900.1 hypothetical protein MJO52_12505 [Microbulbifer variabilis]
MEDRVYNADFVRSTEREYTHSARYIRIKRGSAIKELDHFDLIIAHTAFEGVGSLRSAKLAFVQYGLAKEDYNYGLWRGLADINFVFGNYSQQRIVSVANSIVVGHSVLSSWQKQQAELSWSANEEPIVYYAPTWGEHSSLESSLDGLEELSKRFTLVVAPHHNTIVFNSELIRQIPEKIKIVVSQKDKVDWLLKSQLVVSDISGIIFDAFFLGKKVSVLRGASFTQESVKVGRDSIEYREINNFAVTLNDISSVRKDEFFPIYDPYAGYYQGLISDTLDADERLANEIINYNFHDQHQILREKIRAQWAITDSEKKRIRNENQTDPSPMGQSIRRLLHRLKVSL